MGDSNGVTRVRSQIGAHQDPLTLVFSCLGVFILLARFLMDSFSLSMAWKLLGIAAFIGAAIAANERSKTLRRAKRENETLALERGWLAALLPTADDQAPNVRPIHGKRALHDGVTLSRAEDHAEAARVALFAQNRLIATADKLRIIRNWLFGLGVAVLVAAIF